MFTSLSAAQKVKEKLKFNMFNGVEMIKLPLGVIYLCIVEWKNVESQVAACFTCVRGGPGVLCITRASGREMFGERREIKIRLKMVKKNVLLRGINNHFL